MRPLPAFAITGCTAFTQRKVLLRLVSRTWSHSSGSISAMLVCGKMPALEQRMSTPPKVLTVCLTSFCTSPQSVTSHFL